MTNKEQRRQEWAARIENYKASGQTMAVWCSANGGNIEQLKYWLCKAQECFYLTSQSRIYPRPLDFSYH